MSFSLGSFLRTVTAISILLMMGDFVNWRFGQGHLQLTTVAFEMHAVLLVILSKIRFNT